MVILHRLSRRGESLKNNEIYGTETKFWGTSSLRYLLYLRWQMECTVYSSKCVHQSIMWRHMRFVAHLVCARVANCLCAHGSVILLFISGVAQQRGNKQHNNTRASAQTVHHESTHIILFLTRHNDLINDDKRRSSNIDLSHSPSLHAADDVTTDCRWRRNDQTIVALSREYWFVRYRFYSRRYSRPVV